MTTNPRSPAPKAAAPKSKPTPGSPPSQSPRAFRNPQSKKPFQGNRYDAPLRCAHTASACVTLIDARLDGVGVSLVMIMPETRSRAKAVPARRILPPARLLKSQLSELKESVLLLDRLCCAGRKDIAPRPPEEWAAEFLHLPMNPADTAGYFATALRNAYASYGEIWQKLVLAAAAYAWKLREQDPAYTLPGTLLHTLGKMSQQQQEAWLRHTVDYQVHSYAVENTPLSRDKVEQQLRTLLQS